MRYITFICAFLGFLVGFTGFYEVGLLFSFLLWTLLFKSVYKKFGLLSLISLFLIVFALYGFSIPWSIVFDLNIGEYRKNYLLQWDKIDYTLLVFSLANHIALCGMYLVFSLRKLPKSFCIGIANIRFNSKVKRLFYFSLMLSFIFELINFVRVGGSTTLFEGKLVYQSALSDMGMVLPSELFFYISTSLFAIMLKMKSNARLSVILFFIFNGFYIINNLIIGERGTIVNAIFMFVICYFWDTNVKSIKFKSVLFVTLAYLLLIVITVSRNFFDDDSKIFSLNNIVKYTTDNIETFEFALNPANSEFCTSALNFRVFVEKKTDVDFMYGATYVHFITQLLPKSINPFYSPSLTIQFRDQFFSERGDKGSSGGTAYSSLMEAYMNLGFLGCFIFYAIIFFLLLKLETLKATNNNLVFILFYVLCFELILLFNRSAFEYILIKLIGYLFAIYFLLFISKLKIKV